MRRLVEAIGNGASRKAAYVAAGIAPTTFYSWCAKGKDPNSGVYAAFRAALLDAEAEIEEKMAMVITESAPEDWKAAAWWLERRRPKLFGKRALPPIVVKQEAALTGADHEQLLESIEAALSTRTKQ